MAYTDIDKPSDYFNTVLYTGTGATHNVTGVGFQPDWTWIKVRSQAYSHTVWDSVRGAGQRLITNATDSEETQTNDMSAFLSDGFSLGTGNITNQSSQTYASWNWLAGGTASSNTDGDITSTVSVNQTSGFSIVRWDGNGTAGNTVGHGLGSEMKFMILKDKAQATSWITYHHSLGNERGINLNETGVGITSSNYWNSTSPTSSVFSTGVYSNESAGEYICYCFAEKKGFSKFGSYTSNGVSGDGTFVYLGFKPAFVIHKRTDSAGDWRSWNNKADAFNQNNKSLFPNTSDSEYDTTNVGVDFLSNGIKWRQTDTVNNNPSGGTFIYMAFAESPFTTSTGIPTTAR